MVKNDVAFGKNYNYIFNKILDRDWFSACLLIILPHNPRAIDFHINYMFVVHTLQMLPSQRVLQFSKLMKSTTDVFALKMFPKDILSTKFVTDMINW